MTEEDNGQCRYMNLGSRCVLEEGHRDPDNRPETTHRTENGETHSIYPNKEKANE